MLRIRIFLLIFTLFSFAFKSSAQQKTAEDSILAYMKQTPIVGLSVAVVKNNKIIYNKSFGFKNLSTKEPLENDDIFRIASISKSFSATAIMQLVEKGKLSLDDDLTKLVGFKVRNPKFPDSVITLRMALSHRSSINDRNGYFTLDAINPEKNPDWAKGYNNYAPGADYQYCNLNYNMIGTIIEKVSGERFDRYVQKNILKPLKLYGGYWVDGLDSTRFAAIYEYNVDSGKFFHSPDAYHPRREQVAKYVMGYSTPIFSPTGGMKISAKDLAEVMVMHMKKGKHKGRRIISENSASQMQQKLSEKEGYGMAISTTEKLIDGKVMKGHTGVAYGLFSAMFWQPEEKFGFVVISNGCHPGYTNGYNTVMRRMIDILYRSFFAQN